MSGNRALARHYLTRYPREAASHLDDATPEEINTFLEGEGVDISAKVLAHLRPELAARVIVELSSERLREVAAALDPALTASLLARLSDDQRDQAIAQFPQAVADEVRGILAFPPGTAGSLMDARVAVFREDTPVREAIERIHNLQDRRIADLVLIDKDEAFSGTVRLQDVVGASPTQQLAELRSARAVFTQPMAPRDEVVELLTQYNLSSLPVVDLQNRVVGIIRQAGLVGAAQEDAIGDLQQMVGGSSEERALSKPWVGVKSRLPWLNINLVTAFLAASVVGLFEGTIARFTAVAVLLPVVAGQSGNTGAQALAVTMRGLALREIRVSHGFRVLVKELIIGLINGIAIAIVTSVGVYLWSQNVGLALVMFLAMIVSMVAASAAGAMIPVVLVKLNRDPATASSIILTTVTDVVGFFAFLGLATWFSSMLAGT